jgi:hypothetical protein
MEGASSCGACLEGHVTGATKAPPQEIDGNENDQSTKLPNLAYAEWYAASPMILTLISIERHAAVGWKRRPLHGRRSGVCSRHILEHVQLATTQKGNMSISEYMNKRWPQQGGPLKMKSW